jgi:putative glycosyl hydrolase-like family 15 (GHL15) protein
MLRSVLLSLLAVGLSGVPAPASGAEAGHLRYVKFTSPAFDRVTDAPTARQTRLMRERFWRIVGFTPYFDARTAWHPGALVYKDLYAIGVGSRLAAKHPEWILRDGSGRRLYIPWGCNGRRCAQYAADVTNSAFRRAWITGARRILARGYRGLYIDDVNLQYAVSDATGAHVDPVERRIGAAMTATAWRRHLTGFLTQIRRALPSAEIHHNTVWFSGRENGAAAGKDPYVRAQIRAADTVNLERGIVDSGLSGGAGRWSLAALLDYVDVVHRLHRSVTMDSYATSRARQRYQLAGSLLVSTGADALSDGVSSLQRWWTGYQVHLGAAAGPRRRDRSGLWRRDFARGVVLLDEPDAPARTVPVPAGMCTPDGVPARSVRLRPATGAVLVRCRADRRER